MRPQQRRVTTRLEVTPALTPDSHLGVIRLRESKPGTHSILEKKLIKRTLKDQGIYLLYKLAV